MILPTAEELTSVLEEWRTLGADGEHSNEMCLVFAVAKEAQQRMWSVLKEQYSHKVERQYSHEVLNGIVIIIDYDGITQIEEELR